MAAFIRSIDADIVALQEVPLASVHGTAVDQPAFFGERLGFDYRYGSVAPMALVEPEPEGRTVGAYLWGNAILSRFSIGETEVHALPVTPDDDPAAPIDVEPRCALACTIDTPDAQLTLVSTHLAYLGSRARAPQAARLAELAEETRGALVLAGDLNASIESEELASLSPLVDAFAAVGLHPGVGARESCGVERIDHILVRAMHVSDCRVAREAGDLSDHWPVVARLAISA